MVWSSWTHLPVAFVLANTNTWAKSQSVGFWPLGPDTALQWWRYCCRMRPATTLAIALLLIAIFTAGVISLVMR